MRRRRRPGARALACAREAHAIFAGLGDRGGEAAARVRVGRARLALFGDVAGGRRDLTGTVEACEAAGAPTTRRWRGSAWPSSASPTATPPAPAITPADARARLDGLRSAQLWRAELVLARRRSSPAIASAPATTPAAPRSWSTPAAARAPAAGDDDDARAARVSAPSSTPERAAAGLCRCGASIVGARRGTLSAWAAGRAGCERR
ncbi:MAG: hypothetical protein H6708_09295 [Kofleriaceae bacterium]|nr:hypothetical protein [Kofleriaceae bacterium]